MIKLQPEIDAEGDYSLRSIAPDLTPLIDIIFILIVFLILTSNPAMVELMVDVPKKEKQSLTQYNEDKNNVTLQILSSNKIQYNGEMIGDFEVLKNELKSLKPEQRLVVAGDKKANLETFLKVMSIIESQKIKNVKVLMGDS